MKQQQKVPVIHMTIKLKLIYSAVGLAALFLTIIVFTQVLDSRLNNSIEEVTRLAQDGSRQSRMSGENIQAAQSSLANMATATTTLSNNLQQSNQQVQIVARKINAIAGQLEEFTGGIEDLLEYLPEGDARYEAEDLFDEIGDIQEILNREAIVGLNSMTSSVSQFTADLQSKSAELNQLSDGFSEIVQDTESVQRGNQAIASNFTDLGESQSASASVLMMVLIIAAFIAGAAMVFILGAVTTPLESINKTLGTISQGDLTKRVNITTKDEFGELATSVNILASNTQNVIAEINNDAEKLLSIAHELHDTSENSNKTINEQQEQGESVSDAMLQMAQAVEEVTQAVIATANSSQQTDEHTKSGAEVVNRNVQTMQHLSANISDAAKAVLQLEENCREIDTVIEVIRSIAEQTNLLALNAAIEAARAGEQGRGFAVVADEVRSLATRTHDSTSEINEIIARLNEGSQAVVNTMKTSQQSATAAAESAREIGDMFNIIGEQVGEISKMNNNVAVSAEEQSVMSRDISNSLNVIQGLNHESVSEANNVLTASTDIDNASAKLVDMLHKFKVA